MASQRGRDYKIHLKSERARLKPRREPYWRNVATGRYVGYRKGESGSETWIARYTTQQLDYRYRKLGSLAAVEWKDAVKDANAWFDQCDTGVINSGTVKGACESYVADRRAMVGIANAADADKRLTAHVYNEPIAAIKLDALRAKDVEDWRNAMLERTTKMATRRTFTVLRAALNRSYRLGEVATDAAWKRVSNVSIDQDELGPERYLTLNQRRAIVEVCNSDLADFLRAIGHTAARPQEIASAVVADFDPFSRKLVLKTRKGKDSRLRAREFPLANSDALKFFKRMAKDKLPTAPLLSRSDGSSWYTGKNNNPAWVMPLTRLRKTHGLGAITAYDFRHAAITDLCNAGMSPANVARLTGTSTEQIDRHYMKFVREVVDAQLAALDTV